MADPNVYMIYVSPVNIGASEASYHDKFLDVLGISTLPKRLHIIVPELIHRLPLHLTLPLALLCSPAAIRKIKAQIRRYTNAMIVTNSIGWVEKKLANLFDIPLLGPDPVVAETITSRSFLKRVFMDASVNIPLGAHDVYTLEDLLIALSRLLASNMDVRKWVFRLNSDCNNESCVLFDTLKWPLMSTLRAEQTMLIENNNNNTGAWFSRPVQLSMRKRIMQALRTDLAHRVKICRKDIYENWEIYCRHMRKRGVVIEAEPIEKLGSVEGMCFINPGGKISLCGGVDLCVDDNFQTQGYIAPQTLTPMPALLGATHAIATALFEKWSVIGFVTVKFVAFWDGLDNIPRLWANGLQLGMSNAFSGYGTACLAMEPMNGGGSLPPSLVPQYPAGGKYYVHVPIAMHETLKGSRDDAFFKFCRLRGISFDRYVLSCLALSCLVLPSFALFCLHIFMSFCLHIILSFCLHIFMSFCLHAALRVPVPCSSWSTRSSGVPSVSYALPHRG